MVGRNGVFYDSKGNDWDATVIKIIDHPDQCFPGLLGTLQTHRPDDQRTAGKIRHRQGQSGGSQVRRRHCRRCRQSGETAPPHRHHLPFDIGKFAGIFAAIGLAFGAMATAVASIVGVFLALPIWQMPLAVGGILLAISGPSMLIAFLKLRQRNLGPILDANGWAVNTKASINIPFGSTLTKLAELPKGSERILRDPFAEKEPRWKRWVFLLVLLMALGFAWNKGYIGKWASQLTSLSSSLKTAPPATEVQPAPAAK